MELLTRAQVANLIGHHPGYVRRWANSNGLTGVLVDGHTQYRAADIHRVLDATNRPVPGPLRLARFIRNPLNHTTEETRTDG